MLEKLQQLLDDAKLLKVKSEKYMEGRIDAIHEVMEIWNRNTYGGTKQSTKEPRQPIPELIELQESEVRRSKERYGVEMAIVDYIGRMDTMNDRDAKEWQVLLNAARQLKTLAQELGIVVVMVAQLTSDGGRLAQGSYMKHEADLWINIKRFSDEET